MLEFASSKAVSNKRGFGRSARSKQGPDQTRVCCDRTDFALHRLKVFLSALGSECIKNRRGRESAAQTYQLVFSVIEMQ